MLIDLPLTDEHWTYTDHLTPPDPAQWGEFFKTAATPYGTVTAGAAALGAAGVALHNGTKQRESERARADDELEIERRKLETTWADSDRAHEASVVRDLRARFTTATEQLANPSMTIQQAGAYALGSLADDWLSLPNPNVQEAQVCVDILCTYLRTHHHAAARTEGRRSGDDYDYDVPPADQPVRDSIRRILANHLRDGEEPGPWSQLSFDFSDAHLHNWSTVKAHYASTVSFRNSYFTGTINFTGTHFTGDTDFTRTSFIGLVVLFHDTHFLGDTHFHRTTVTAIPRFTKAHFSGTTVFMEIRFKNALFTESRFSGSTFFDSLEFGGKTIFRNAEFTGDTRFSDISFSGTTDFRKAIFSDGVTRFDDPASWNRVITDWDKDGRAPEHVVPTDWPPTCV